MYKANEPLELTLLYHWNSPPPGGYAKQVPATEMRYMPEAALVELPAVPPDNYLTNL